MKCTRFACDMAEILHRAHKVHEQFVAQLDLGQFPMAGIELGRLVELGERLASTARLTRDALHEDAWLAEQQAKAVEMEAEPA